MKTCKTGCGKMKTGGTIKKIKKMATGGQALNKAKGYAPAQKGGDNVSKQIYGIPNAGTTGPNRTAGYQYKKGGAVKKYQDGGSKSKNAALAYDKQMLAKQQAENMRKTYKATEAKRGEQERAKMNETMTNKFKTDALNEMYPNYQGQKKKGGSAKSKGCPPGYYWSVQGCQEKTPGYKKPFSSTGSKVGIGTAVAGVVGTAVKAVSDKIKARKAEKEKTKKEGETPKAKFGASVNVQRGYPGKIRSAKDQGYTAVGKREPARTKFAKGGFPDLTGDGKVTKADVLKGRGVIKKKGGSVKKK